MMPEAAMGEIDETARAAMQHHAGECGECAGALRFHSELHEAIESAPLAAAPDLYLESVLAEIHRRLPPPVRARAKVRRRISREGAATFAAASLFFIWFSAHIAPALGGLAPERSESASARSATRLSASASVGKASSVVLIRGVGFISADSAIWHLPEDMLEQIILPVGPASIHDY